jgi:hypothetical protein
MTLKIITDCKNESIEKEGENMKTEKNMGLWPSIDHSFISPNGSTSALAKRQYMERFSKELFPEGFPQPTCPQPTEKESLLRHARMWRELAERGVGPRKHLKAAIEAELKASKL